VGSEQGERRPILLVGGEGGHAAQASRFAVQIRDEAEGVMAVLLTEDAGVCVPFEGQLILRRNLSRLSKFRGPRALVAVGAAFCAEFLAAPFMLRRLRPCGLVAFGPLFCLPVCIWARVMGLKVVYVESWSRFYERSLTGRAMGFLANKIYYQNETLVNVFKDATYAGRL